MRDNSIILFQGDSITDCGRDRENVSGYMGNGYAMMVASRYLARFPESKISFINKGISANRTVDLVNRWQEDCIDIKPDFLTLLIGINDTGRRYDANLPTSSGQFEKNYRFLLDSVRDKSPHTRIILMQPFLIPSTEERLVWREDLAGKIEVVNRLAEEYKTRYIPLDGIFGKLCKIRPASFWSKDSVHLTSYGHAIIADQLEKALNSAGDGSQKD